MNLRMDTGPYLPKLRVFATGRVLCSLPAVGVELWAQLNGTAKPWRMSGAGDPVRLG